MANRVETVTLTAQVSNYIAGMRAAQAETDKLAAAGAAKFAATNEALNTIAPAFLAVGAVAAVGVGLAVAKYAEFDQAISNVKAQTQETASNMALLRDAALEAGGRTIFTATEAANAIEELGKAGLSTKDILNGGLNGALDLAASSQLGVARAAEITATTLKQYGLAGDQAGRVADVLAAGAGKALGSVEDLSAGMKYVGPVAAGMSISLEDTAAALSLFADQGILGEQAGTSLRGVLSSLTSPSKLAADEIKRLGITLYDSQGQFLGLKNLTGQLAGAYKDSTDAQKDFSLGVIFGNAQVTAARVLVGQGAQSFQEYRKAVDDTGFAARVARDRLDNLRGDVEKLGGAFETAFIKSGSGANDVLRGMVQGLTGVVDAIGNAPQPVLNTGLAITAVGGAVALAAGAVLTAIPRVAEFKDALNTLGPAARTVGIAVGAATVALTAVIVVFGAVAAANEEAEAKAQSYADTLEKGTNRISNATRDLAKQNLATEKTFLGIGNGSAFDAAEKLGISLKTVTDAATGNVKALKQVRDALDVGSVGTQKYNDALKRSGLDVSEFTTASLTLTDGIKGEAKSIEQAIKIAEQKQKADAASAEGSQNTAEGYLQAADAAGQLGDQLTQLVDQINKVNGVGQDAISANIAYQDALAKVDEQVQKARQGAEGYGLGLDLTTEAGRKNAEALNTLAEKSAAAAQAQFTLDGNTTKFQASLEAGRQSLIDRAIQLGATADEATRFADQVYRIPSQKEFQIIADTRDAQQQLDRFFTLNDGRKIYASVVTEGTSRRPGFAGGGYITGAGTPTSDSIPAMLSNGEYVIRASVVNEYGRGYFDNLNYRRSYADGGYVNDRPVYRTIDVPSVTAFSPAGSTEVTNYITAPQITDPYVLGTVLGRELRRMR